MRIKHTLISSLLVSTTFLSANLHAKEVIWDTHDAVEVGVGLPPPGAIDDTYRFTLVEPALLYASAVANSLNGTLGIKDGMVSLLRSAGDGAPSELIADFTFDGTTGDITSSFGQLAAGDYFYRISGMTNGLAGGVYSLTSEVVPVPEPATGALVATAALALLLLGRRRSRE